VRAAPRSVVVDAAILIAALLGRSSIALSAVGEQIALVTTDRAVQEARRRVELGLKRPDLIDGLDRLITQIDVVPAEALGAILITAQAQLKDSVPSRNGAVADAHILALAWQSGAEIWSHDRDFAGTGVASWSTLNLLRAVAQI